jgi:hypothetical protein
VMQCQVRYIGMYLVSRQFLVQKKLTSLFSFIINLRGVKSLEGDRSKVDRHSVAHCGAHWRTFTHRDFKFTSSKHVFLEAIWPH